MPVIDIRMMMMLLVNASANMKIRLDIDNIVQSQKMMTFQKVSDSYLKPSNLSMSELDAENVTL